MNVEPCSRFFVSSKKIRPHENAHAHPHAANTHTRSKYEPRISVDFIRPTEAAFQWNLSASLQLQASRSLATVTKLERVTLFLESQLLSRLVDFPCEACALPCRSGSGSAFQFFPRIFSWAKVLGETSALAYLSFSFVFAIPTFLCVVVCLCAVA